MLVLYQTQHDCDIGVTLFNKQLHEISSGVNERVKTAPEFALHVQKLHGSHQDKVSLMTRQVK